MRTRTVLAGAAGLAAVGIGRRVSALARVAPELRRPLLLIPLSVNRVTLRLMRANVTPPPLPPDVLLTERRVPGSDSAKAFAFDPVDRTSTGALLWIHGGGFVGGQAAGDHALCARIASELGILVVSVEYRLAPEHPFPEPLDDCFAALRWLHVEAEALGIDPARIAVGGASAGAGLAAATVQRAHDEGVAVAFQLLLYPMLDDRTVLAENREDRGRFVWTPASNRFGWASYLGHAPGDPEPRPYAAPGRRTDLDGFPPAWIGVGELDLFFDEDLEYSRRLEAAGVPVTFVGVPGMYHGADGFAAGAPSMRRFRDGMIEALREAVAVPA